MHHDWRLIPSVIFLYLFRQLLWDNFASVWLVNGIVLMVLPFGVKVFGTGILLLEQLQRGGYLLLILTTWVQRHVVDVVLKVIVLLSWRHELNFVLVVSWTYCLKGLVSLVKGLLLILSWGNLSHSKGVILLYFSQWSLVSSFPVTLWCNVFLNIGAAVQNHSLHVPSLSSRYVGAGTWQISFVFHILFPCLDKRFLFVRIFVCIVCNNGGYSIICQHVVLTLALFSTLGVNFLQVDPEVLSELIDESYRFFLLYEMLWGPFRLIGASILSATSRAWAISCLTIFGCLDLRWFIVDVETVLKAFIRVSMEPKAISFSSLDPWDVICCKAKGCCAQGSSFCRCNAVATELRIVSLSFKI